MKLSGKGSQYAVVFADKTGNDLSGAKTYTLNIADNVPANDFWSVVRYDPQTRQPFPGKNNKRDGLVANTDGSVNLYFGPKPPAGKEKNSLQTVPGKGWFACLRLYGPTDPWFDQTWRPGEIEEVK